jgi:hypothetical protein
MSCFDFLVGLHDDHFDEIKFFDQSISGVLLEKVLQQSAKRKNVFDCITFTPDQSRTLATSGTGTDIGLYRCKFEDDGAEFLEALAAREDPQTGLAKLVIVNFLPFAERIFVLHQPQLESLTLSNIHLKSEDACRAVVEAELQYLELANCKLGDGGVSLVESMREGRGPKGLRLYTSYDDEGFYDWRPFDSSERVLSFLNALRGNTYLERLDLSGFDLREEEILPALAATGLAQLRLSSCCLDESGFCKVLRAISTHPSLRTLDLACCSLHMNETEATEEVAMMLSVNKQLEEIRIADLDDLPFFDSAAWDKLVSPRLDCNVYRKRFPAIQEIRVPSTRAAVMTRALSHVSNKPSPAFMLLRQNSDILSSYSLRIDPQIATSSGKRSRSPSSDGRGVSNLGP